MSDEKGEPEREKKREKMETERWQLYIKRVRDRGRKCCQKETKVKCKTNHFNDWQLSRCSE